MADRPLRESTETIRIPLYSTEEQRIHSARNQGTLYYGGTDQQLVNCFPILAKDPLAPDSPVVKIVNRLGLAIPEDAADTTGKVNDPDMCQPLAALSFSSLVDVLVTAHWDHSDSKVYILQHRPVNNTVVQIKVIDTSVAPWNGVIPQVFLSELNIGNVPYLGVVLSIASIGGASGGWWAASSSGTFPANVLNEITDNDFPPKQLAGARKITGPMVQMDGYTFVLTEDGYIYNSDLNSISVWNTSGYVGAISRPDRGVTLARYKHHLVAFGDSTIEFFNNEGIAAPNSPLKRTQQAYIAMGALGPKAVINLDDTIYWLAKSSTGAIGLWKLEGYDPSLVSNYYHSYLTQSSASEPNLQAITMYGTRHLITNLVRSHNIGWLPQKIEKNITAVSVGATTTLTVGTHTYTAGMSVYVNGLTGANAGTLNNKWFTISSTGATTIVLPVDTTAMTITAPGTAPYAYATNEIEPYNGSLVGTPVYCIDSNAWWVWAFEFTGFYGQIHVARSNPAVGGGYQSTYVWSGVGAIDNVNDNYGLHPTILMDVSEFHPNTASYDGLRDGNATSILYWRIPVAILTNVYDFNNENRKFIKKVKLIGDTIEWPTDRGTEPDTSFRGEGLKLSFVYSKVENARSNPSEWTQRDTQLPVISDHTYNYPQPRMYWNNLGAGRTWKFGIFIDTWVPVRFEALEITVGQGTH